MPSSEAIPLEEDTNVLIEKIRGENAHRFYLASVYPVEEGRVLWRIESIFGKDTVEYRLFFKNFHKQTTNVKFRVYKL